MSRKLVIDDGRSQRELLVVGTMVVGRDPECEISSSDQRLSRKHAEFRATSSSVVVRDLGSRNGVRVNGRPVTEAALAPGDVVSIAHLSVRFLDESELEPPGPRPMGAPITIAAPVEDDRTRSVSKSAIAAASAPAVAVRPDGGDDRTRVLPAGTRGRVATAPTAVMNAMPSDVGEIVIRDDRGSTPRAPASTTVDTPVEMPAGMVAELGVQALAGTGWGRRVLMQGLLLVLVVYLITVIPLLAWQSRVFGASALQAWSVLLPTLGASVFAGIMVAGLIARTAGRGVQSGRRG